MDLLGKKVLVAGCGKSGLGAAGLLQKAGAVPVLFDENEKLDGKALCAREDYPKDTALVLGSLPKELLSELSLAVLSPGISIEEAFVSTLEEADIPVWSEIELAWNYEKGKVLAITGTNGKTTTTTLVGEIMKRYQDNTFVVGNIGTPYTQEVLKTDKDSVTVAEISSFQLETIMDFHPDVSAILNITPDHLDRHGSMENYIRIKECITMNQTAKDAVVLNYDDPVLREFGESRIEEPEPAEDAADTETEAVAREDGLDGAEDLREPDETAGEEPEQSETEVTETVSESEAEETDPEEVLSGLKARVFWFSSRERLKEGFFLDGDNIVYADGTKEQILVNVKELQLLGRHNYENVMAAAYIGLLMGVPFEKIRETVRKFKPVEHRIEFVRERTGVRYYNDSKGTNPDAAIQALRAMPGPVLLIAGGYDKNSTYDEWAKEFAGRVKYLVLIGKTRDKIAACAKKYGFTEIMYAEDLKEAVQVCAVYADAGDYVLLSPACASWDQFKSYEQRGELFKEYVRAL